jgi:predicted nucleic acid-binding Zn ribbon protein
MLEWANPTNMERASKLIRRLRLPGDAMSAEELVCAAWPEAVGKKIAAHTRAARLVRTRLVVEAEDHIWQRQLFALTPHVLRNLERSLGPGLVEDLEFRVVPRRREPQRAQRSAPALFQAQTEDEADGIIDPVLRDIYRTSRKRALA